MPTDRTCACRHPDAGQCYRWRYPSSDEDTDYGEPERCECCCHDCDEDESDGQ